MHTESEKVLRTSLTRMSKIINQTASKSHIAENRSIYAIAQTINKLSAQDLPRQLVSIRDLASDSLEKVNYYIDLALHTFEGIRAPFLNEEQQANFFFALSETYEILGNYGSALTNYNTSLNIFTALKNQSMQGQIQYRMARIFSERGDWQKAQDMLTRAVLKLQSAGNNTEAALAQIEMAKIAYRRGEYQKAQDMFQVELETFEFVSDIRSKATVSHHLGIIRRMTGEHDLAYNHFQEALIEFQSIQDFRGTAESLNNIGIVHLRQKKLKQAIGYFEKSHQLCLEIGYFPLLAFVYLNKAEFYIEIGDLPMASITCARALEYLVRLKNPISLAKTNMMFGRIFGRSGEHQSAKAFYKESIRLYKEFGIPLGVANCSREFAQMLEETGNAEESSRFYSKAQQIYNKLNMQMLAVKNHDRGKSIQDPGKKPIHNHMDHGVSIKAE